MTQTAPPATSPPARRPRRGTARRGVALGVAAVVLVVFAVGGYLMLFGRDSSSGPEDEGCPSVAPLASRVLPPPGTVTVSVLNGTERAGLARSAAVELTNRGFQVKTVGNWRPKLTGPSQIRYVPESLQAARLVAFQVPGARLVPDRQAADGISVLLGPPFAGIQNSQQVAADLRKAGYTLANATPTCLPG